MSDIKTKSIKNLEEKIESFSSDEIRCQILQDAKSFKTSWIGLGQALYTVYKDKLYKNWGYQKFDTYASKEIGIRKQTALKLLKSYCFLEKEEPLYLKKEFNSEAETAGVPNYESVNLLRLAKNKKELDKSDYLNIRRDLLENGKDASAVRKDLTSIIKQREELLPEEAWLAKKTTLIKRFLSSLKSIREEIKVTKLLPASVIKDADNLIDKLESQIQ